MCDAALIWHAPRAPHLSLPKAVTTVMKLHGRHRGKGIFYCIPTPIGFNVSPRKRECVRKSGCARFLRKVCVSLLNLAQWHALRSLSLIPRKGIFFTPPRPIGLNVSSGFWEMSRR